MKKAIYIILVLSFMNVLVAQDHNADFLDGRIWFKIKDDVVLNKKEYVKGDEAFLEKNTLKYPIFLKDPIQ